MKKLYLSITLLGMFILMFSITMIPIQASSYNDPLSNQLLTLETPITLLNNYSLREVYDEYNDFADNLDTWIANGGTKTVVDNTFILNPNDTSSNVYANGTLLNTMIYDGLSIYVNTTVNILGDFNVLRFYPAYTNTGAATNTIDLDHSFDSNTITNISTKSTFSSSDSWFGNNNYVMGLFQIDYSGIAIPFGNALIVHFEDTVVLNLNTLGLENVSKELLDYYYKLYIILYNGLSPNEFYNQGYDAGEDYGYLDGYNDGLVEGEFDGYNDGYTVGYNEGMDYAATNNITLLSVFQLIIGVVMSMLGFIINIELFGISIASVLGTLAIGIAIIWTLKLIRG